MVSVVPGGTAVRIAARTLFKVLRAGSGTPARYSSTSCGAPLPFAAEPRFPDFTFFMRAMLQEFPSQVHARGHQTTRRESPRLPYGLLFCCFSVSSMALRNSSTAGTFGECSASFVIYRQAGARSKGP